MRTKRNLPAKDVQIGDIVIDSFGNEWTVRSTAERWNNTVVYYKGRVSAAVYSPTEELSVIPGGSL